MCRAAAQHTVDLSTRPMAPMPRQWLQRVSSSHMHLNFTGCHLHPRIGEVGSSEFEISAFLMLIDLGLISSPDFGSGTARAEDAQRTPTQSHISPRILVYEEIAVPC